jgi:uncharacterized protein (DUF3820 family)
VEHHLPYGAHRDRPLTEVPTDHLVWFLRECKPPYGLHWGVCEELARRGLDCPVPLPAPPVMPRCRKCPRGG